MKTKLNQFLAACLAIYRHLARKRLAASALVAFSTTGCFITDSNDNEVDADQDGVIATVDCDDGNPNIGAPPEGRTCEELMVNCEDDPDCIMNVFPDEPEPLDADEDGDGVPASIDCNDQAPNIGAPPEGMSCDELMVSCEDDPECEIVCNPIPEEIDSDEDGVPSWQDCDDNDPNVGARPAGEECPEIIINPVPDNDGDGAPFDEDCDDDDSNVGAPPEGEECPEIIVNPLPDSDGDGVPEWEDCDDDDPDVGAAPEGEECPGELTCEEDPDCIINPVPDGDGDGVPEWEDCDDDDPDVGAPPRASEPTPEDVDCEGDPNCDIIVNRVPDADRDGVPAWEDCDDNDPCVGREVNGRECPMIIVNPLPDDEDGDGVPASEDCDDRDPNVGAAPDGESCPSMSEDQTPNNGEPLP